MKLMSLYLLIVVLFISCTGQKPADIKNSTASNRPVKAECNSIKVQGEVLTKNNILDIFECSGWSKQYPTLVQTVKQADEVAVNHVLSVFNKSLLKTEEHQKKFFTYISHAENKGQLDNLSQIIERSLKDHRFLTQLTNVLDNKSVTPEEQLAFLRVLSTDNEVNLKYLRVLKNASVALNNNKGFIKKALSLDNEERFRKRLITLLDDLATQMEPKHWKHFSDILYKNDSSLKNWAIDGVDADLSILLRIIKDTEFNTSVGFLKKSINTKVVCSNEADDRVFTINVGQELKHKIDSLRQDSAANFERQVLHGLTKYLAFQEFCQEEIRHQGVKSFFKVLTYVHALIPSSHDFNFIKDLHKTFGVEDRFLILDFLSGKTFEELRDLFITVGPQDQELVRSLYRLMIDVSDEDLKIISEFTSKLSQNQNEVQDWYNAGSQIWMKLNYQQKDEFLKFLSMLTADDLNITSALEMLEELFVMYPDLSSNLSGNLYHQTYQQNLRYVVAQLSDESVQSELSHFLSHKGLFEFFRVLTSQQRKQLTLNQSPEPAKSPESKLSKSKRFIPSILSPEVGHCFNYMASQYQKNPSYYPIVNNIPKACISVLGEVGFAGQIYLWMHRTQAFFEKEFKVTDFHAATGVWAPGMLHFVFSAAVNANMNLRSDKGTKGILLNIDSIHSYLTHKNIMETVHLTSKVYSKVSSKTNFESNFQNFLEVNKRNVNEWAGHVFDLLKPTERKYITPKIDSDCSKNFSSELGIEPCLSSVEVSTRLIEMLRIAKRSNGDTTLMKELIRWLHPQGGIGIPFNRPKYNKNTSIEEIIYFLRDLSTHKNIDFDYHYKDKITKVRGSTIDRLEVVIRDIAFTNNFYGAYFKNDVASAKNYRDDVSGSEKLLKMLDAGSFAIRLPEDAEWRLMNVRNTFSSLVEVSDVFASGKTYGPFIQSLLAAITKSSRKDTQNFNPYTLWPSSKTVDGHNGLFLTEVVRLSGLRHMAHFVHTRLGDFSALNTPEFKAINDNLIARHDLRILQDSVQNILDKYLDSDEKQLNKMIEDTVLFLDKISPAEQQLLEEIILKGLILLSDKNIETKKIQKLAESIELVIKHWKQVKKILPFIDDPKGEKVGPYLKLIIKVMDSVISQTGKVDTLVGVILNSNAIKMSEVENLLKDDEFAKSAQALVKHLAFMDSPKTDLNWSETFKAILADSSNDWSPIIQWLDIAMDQKPSKKLTFSLLLQVLGEKDNKGNYRLKFIMDEVFINHREHLEQFLEETFPALELNN